MTVVEARGHIPVLPAEVVTGLEPGPGKVYIDATLGGGGHAMLLLERGATVIGLDQDPMVIARYAGKPPAGLSVVQANFRDMEAATAALLDGRPPDGVLFDLGVSSFQLDTAERGFSFHADAPLDMRMGSSGPTAAEVLENLDVEELAEALYRYGDERHSRRIARAIISARDAGALTGTVALSEVIRRAYPGGHARGIHPARRSFQALRILVNDELGALRNGLAAATRLLPPGGRLAVISFQSLEDRIVKQTLRGDPAWRPLSKRPVTPSELEQLENPRSRSAKLRVAERTGAASQPPSVPDDDA